MFGMGKNNTMSAMAIFSLPASDGQTSIRKRQVRAWGMVWAWVWDGYGHGYGERTVRCGMLASVLRFWILKVFRPVRKQRGKRIVSGADARCQVPVFVPVFVSASQPYQKTEGEKNSSTTCVPSRARVRMP